ncbi:TrmH family RNA methyltransferase [Mariniflexile ostreae]|uniref:TrmH family RNA methyltransferase n=1 Tax=Mariniflexile ostreae TaxID=1520892 RepID=A0ABV5F817_9FLAO
MQLTHYNTKFIKRNFPIILVCDNVSNASNIGSLFRLSDAFGVEKIIFCGLHVPLGRKIAKTSRATEKVVAHHVSEQTLPVVERLKKEGYHIISLEITHTSIPLNTFTFSKENPIALIVGDENFGVSESILKLSDNIIHIEMFGKNSSMNVAQATNITLYEMTKQLF